MEVFTNKDICKITGFSTRQVCYLAESGIITAEGGEASGRGSYRRFSRENLFEIFLVEALRNSNIEYKYCKLYTRGLVEHWKGYREMCYECAPFTRAELYIFNAKFGFVVDGNTDNVVSAFSFDDQWNCSRNVSSDYQRLKRDFDVKLLVHIYKVISKVRKVNS